MLDLESQRLTIQVRLDAAKTSLERNQLGQFATPPNLALEIAQYALSLRKQDARPASFLDPAIGSGSFYSALKQVFPPGAVADARGVELDPAFADAAAQLWTPSGLRITPGDFTRIQPDRLYDLVLTNPPYVRHHHIERAEKERLKSLVADRFGLNISGLAGLYAYFLLLCDTWMAPGGIAFWLIPSEFMDVNYGTAIKSYLTDRVKLLHIHRYCPSDVQFCDALVTSAIVVFEKSRAPENHQVQFSFGGSITKPTTCELTTLPELRKIKKWTLLASGSIADSAESHALGDLFSIKRGLATGANSFFILGRDDAIRKGIPAEYLRPILPSSRHLKNAVIEADQDGYPHLEKPLALIDCDLPEEMIQKQFPAFWQYLEQGKAKGIDTGYLASRRLPWYSQEKRPPAPFLCTYMGRQGSSGNPFRFYWNKSRAAAANVFLMIYPNSEMQAVLAARPDLYPIIFAHLQSLTGEHLMRQGRVYGGGLHKLEPKELANLPAGQIARMIKKQPSLKQMQPAL